MLAISNPNLVIWSRRFRSCLPFLQKRALQGAINHLNIAQSHLLLNSWVAYCENVLLSYLQSCTLQRQRTDHEYLFLHQRNALTLQQNCSDFVCKAFVLCGCSIVSTFKTTCWTGCEGTAMYNNYFHQFFKNTVVLPTVKGCLIRAVKYSRRGEHLCSMHLKYVLRYYIQTCKSRHLENK